MLSSYAFRFLGFVVEVVVFGVVGFADGGWGWVGEGGEEAGVEGGVGGG